MAELSCALGHYAGTNRKMRSKAIKDLGQLKDSVLFKEIAEGIDLIVNHVLQIKADSICLSLNGKPCGYNILEAIAAEESSKVLISLTSAPNS